ncbi:hypothetical protein ACINWC743_1140 [Acinetobacter sp. WC-743]|nr:hypothetical protein ACINWC743_1140 [Acinetobacter sp. WC-743]
MSPIGLDFKCKFFAMDGLPYRSQKMFNDEAQCALNWFDLL